MTPHRGNSGKATLSVDDADTAVALGSGDVAVLGSPRIVALCERAAVAAVADYLDEGTTSVGLGIDLKHFKPTPVGATVTAEAHLENAEGRKLTFTCRVIDAQTREEVARARHVRVMVDRMQFLDKAGVEPAPPE